MAATSDQSPPKRNSGRTGTRRLTQLEVAARDQHAKADHQRRYGTPLAENARPVGEPPRWFSARQKAIWRETLAGAPPGLLKAGDADNLVVLCTAIELYRRLSRQVADLPEDQLPPVETMQQIRTLGAEIGRASRVLGLNPAERARIGLPVLVEERPAEQWGPLKVINGRKAS
jgi:phage terminase small subunit